MSTGVTNRMGEAAEGEGTDGGSERAEEIGETDHLRSVGRQRKPVGEGRSPLDSVLQRDRRRGRGGATMDGGKNGNKEIKLGQRMVKTDARRAVKGKAENWLRCREPSGGKIARGVGEIWVVIPQLLKMPVRPRCLH